MKGKAYNHAKHTHAVITGSAARCSARMVLMEMCRRSEFDAPETTVTKAQLVRVLGFTLKTVKAALAELRAEGSIVPIKHFEGGRGNATTYRLDVVGQGAAVGDPEAGQGRPCPPAMFSRWHKLHGMSAAMTMKKRYEAGETI